MNSLSQITRTLTLLCTLWFVSQTALAKNDFAVVKAGTEEQLISAILAANESGKPTIIRLAARHYVFTSTFDSEFRESWLPPVSGTLVIVGRDSGSTVFEPEPEMIGRAFTVLNGGSLVLRDVTITRGLALCISDEGCERTQGGGAIANIGGVLWLENCVLNGSGAASRNAPRRTVGGGILSIDGHLHLEDTTVMGNQAQGEGGGIAIYGGTATIRRSIISGNSLVLASFNSAYHFGGGIFATDAKVSVDRSTISGNTINEVIDEWIGLGAGIYTAGGTLWLTNSAVTENFINRMGSGAGIANNGEMIITNTTIAGNSAPTLGGGINNNGPLTLQSVTIIRNEVLGRTSVGIGQPAYPYGCSVETQELCISSGGGVWNEPTGTVHFATSVIAANTSRAGASDCDGVLISAGHNAVGSDSRCDLQGSAASDQVNVNPQLGDLQDNGDPGNAHAPPLANSPLIDAGGKVSQACTARDQLDHRRTDGDHDGKIQCDVGAIEFLPH